MSLHNAQPFVLGFSHNKPIEVEQVQENLSSDAGLLAFAYSTKNGIGPSPLLDKFTILDPDRSTLS